MHDVTHAAMCSSGDGDGVDGDGRVLWQPFITTSLSHHFVLFESTALRLMWSRSINLVYAFIHAGDGRCEDLHAWMVTVSILTSSDE